MSKSAATKELNPNEMESKKPVIYGQEIQRKEDYWFATFNNGWNSLSVMRTTKEQAKEDKKNAEWREEVKDKLKEAGVDTRLPPIIRKEGEIVVGVETVRWYLGHPMHRYHTMLGISGKEYQDMRAIRETADFGRGSETFYKDLNDVEKRQILSDVQNFLLRDPRGIAWLREMEEKDGLFRKIKPEN